VRRRVRGAVLIALLLSWSQGLAADAKSAVEAYVARLAGTAIEDLSATQTFTLYHPDGRQRVEQDIEGRREIRVTVGDRVWIRQGDGRTYEAPPSDSRRDRVHLLTAFQRGAADLLREWESAGVRAGVSDEVLVGGRPVTIVGAKAGERDRPAVWIDPEYGVIRFITHERLPKGSALVDIVFSDHRPLVDRFFYPHRQEVFAEGKLLLRVEVRSVTVNTRLAPELFDPEALKRGR
jgi:hypothetical protein